MLARPAFSVGVEVGYDCPLTGRSLVVATVGRDELYTVVEACSAEPKARDSIWAEVQCPDCGQRHGIRLWPGEE